MRNLWRRIDQLERSSKSGSKQTRILMVTLDSGCPCPSPAYLEQALREQGRTTSLDLQGIPWERMEREAKLLGDGGFEQPTLLFTIRASPGMRLNRAPKLHP